AGPALPFLSAPFRAPAGRARPRRRPDRPPRGLAPRGHTQGQARRLQGPPHPRGRLRPGLVPRDRAAVGKIGGDRVGPPGRVAGAWGSRPLEGGIEAAYKAQLEASDDPESLRHEIERRMNMVRSPFRTAESFLVEEIIDPRDTRPLLCEFAELAAPLRAAGTTARGFRP